MNRQKWVLLIFELALFAIILVLPQVDLPDFTFHAGTAPVVAKSRVSPSPVRVAIAAPTLVSVPIARFETPCDDSKTTVSPSPSSRLSLLCTFLC